jgi:hypothetical protein
MSTRGRPSSIDGIKRHAKAITKSTGLKHARALDQAAMDAGFQNVAHAHRMLAAPPSRPDSREGYFLEKFHVERRAAWIAAINSVNPGHASTVKWESLQSIQNALEPFMGHASNHGHFPTGGGLDFLSVASSNERGCLEFSVGESVAYVAKPKRLVLERIGQAPAESFLILDLAQLAPSGVYQTSEEESVSERTSLRRQSQEELVELSPGKYLDRGVWDEGNLGYDESGHEIPLPESARLIVRWLRGRILFVCKGSMWNGDPSTYDGRHDRMTDREIRQLIERSIAARV